MYLCHRSRSLPAVILFLLILLIALPGPAAGADKSTNTPPLAVKTGVFVMSIYDLSLKDKSFDSVFWAWFVFPEDAPIRYVPEETVGVMGTKSFTRLFHFDEVTSSRRWVTVKFDAVLIHNWDMDDFPFDKQILTIELEEAQFDATKIRFIPDTKNSGIDSSVSIPGWEVEGFSIQSRLDTDETTFGDPTLSDKSTYPETIVTIALKRHGTRLLFNLLTAAYIAFILGILVLFLHPKYVDARKVFITSAMITIIGNHYIISATLPEMHTFTLIDRVMITTFIAICLIAFISVVTAHYVRIKKTRSAVLINAAARWAILTVYVVLNVIFFVRALT
jgi:hypothetical protein